MLAMLLVVGRVCSAFAQTGENYTVTKDFTQLPAGTAWAASTSGIAADGKGTVVVFVRAAPYFHVFTRDGKFVSRVVATRTSSSLHTACSSIAKATSGPRIRPATPYSSFQRTGSF
jgi:hypothetical protein